MAGDTSRKQKKGLSAYVDRGALMRLVRQGALYSAVVNLMALASPLFFTQVYDRVLTTGNWATLVALTFIALLAVAIGSSFEHVRSVVFLRVGAGFYVDLEPHVYRASHARSLAGAQGRRGIGFDDLETVRGFLASPAPGAALDALFAPLFLTILFLIHTWVGVFALGAIAVLALVAALTQWGIGDAMRGSAQAHVSASNLAESQLRGAEAAAAMGFYDRAQARWAGKSRDAILEQARAAARAGGLNATARGMRVGAQILVIAIAAGFALRGEVSPGAIIASSILLARLLAPVDQLLGSWRQLAQARLAAQRLSALLDASEQAPPGQYLKPAGKLTIDALFARSPEEQPILRGISLRAEPGEIIAVIGPTGAGKSTFLRSALGVWPYVAGSVRLDGVPLLEANRDEVGRYLGFLPQNAELWPGTIAQNISRFEVGDDVPNKLKAAIETSGVADVIKKLPNGLNTDAGEAGAMLSSGQRRRIALARALYGDPVFVCLDEPEAHLDRDGELALQRALAHLKARGAVVLFAAHQLSSVAGADKILVLHDGAVRRFGPTQEILPAVSGPIRQVAP